MTGNLQKSWVSYYGFITWVPFFSVSFVTFQRVEVEQKQGSL